MSIDTLTCLGRTDHLVVVSFLEKSIVDRFLEQFTFILTYAKRLHFLFSELGFCSQGPQSFRTYQKVKKRYRSPVTGLKWPRGF